MAGSLTVQLAWFVSELQGEGLTVILGWPVWNRSTCTPPVVAVRYVELEPDASARVGQTPLRRGHWAVTLFGRDEPDLLTMIDTVLAWATTAASAVIDGQRYPLGFLGGQRVASETGAQQEAYAFELRYGLRV